MVILRKVNLLMGLVNALPDELWASNHMASTWLARITGAVTTSPDPPTHTTQNDVNQVLRCVFTDYVGVLSWRQ